MGRFPFGNVVTSGPTDWQSVCMFINFHPFSGARKLSGILQACMFRCVCVCVCILVEGWFVDIPVVAGGILLQLAEDGALSAFCQSLFMVIYLVTKMATGSRQTKC